NHPSRRLELELARGLAAGPGAKSAVDGIVDGVGEEPYGPVEEEHVDAAGVVAGGTVDLARPRPLAEPVDKVHRIEILLALVPRRIRPANVAVAFSRQPSVGPDFPTVPGLRIRRIAPRFERLLIRRGVSIAISPLAASGHLA